jgi:hypothetical protein
MKLPARNVVWLLPLFLTACAHEPKPQMSQQYAPPVSTVPKPPVLHPDLPVAALTLPLVDLDTDTDDILDAAAKPTLKKKKPPVHTAQETAPETPASTATQQTASNDTTPAEVPAIGVLSSTDPPDLRRETIDTLDDTERGLKGIGRSLTNQEQKTVSQIRQYIRQARKALDTGDVDGAHTLAAKAKVLLGELNE